MLWNEINELLRVMARKVISMGYKKTNIGRTLFGASSYPMFLRFIDEEEEKDFGIKPLARAADVLGYELRMVFVDPKKNQTNEDPLLDELETRNKRFLIELEKYLVDNLNQGKGKRARKSTLDIALDSILGISKPEELPDELTD